MKKDRIRMGAEEISVFCEQISLILTSNIPLYEGLEALAGDYAASVVAQPFGAMIEEIKTSGSLTAAVEAANVFPGYMVGMVRIGEESGQLDTVMTGLAGYYRQQAQIRASAASAVCYPLTLMAVMALVITVLVFQVIPIFEKAFRSLTGGMVGASASMLRVGQAAGIAVFVLMLLMIGTAIALYMLLRNGGRDALRAKVMRTLPPLMRLHRMMTAQKFASVLSMLLGSGFPIEQALEMMPEVFAGQQEKDAMKEAAAKAMEGALMADIIEESGMFDALYMRMIRVGFASGQADAALGKVADLQAQAIEDAMAQLIALIEPALVIVLSAMIGAILLSVMMPLAGVLSVMA